MLTDEQLRNYYNEHNVSLEGRETIDHIRRSEPERRVASGERSVACRYPSRKMQRVIQAESHLNELPFVVTREFDDDCYEIWDQPISIELAYLSPKGRAVKVWHTPDYFLIMKEFCGFTECKTEEELEKLAKRMPYRYVKLDDGTWRCPPGEAAAEKLGLQYRVHSSAEINYILYRNLDDLGSYYRPTCKPVTPEATIAVLSIVQAEPHIRLDHLYERLKTTVATADDVRKLIVTEKLYVDLFTDPLPEPDRVHCFRDKITAASYVLAGSETAVSLHRPALIHPTPGATITYDGRPLQILLVGDTEILFQDINKKSVLLPRDIFEALIKQNKIQGFSTSDDAGSERLRQVHEMLDKTSPEDLYEANRRYRILQFWVDERYPTDEEKKEYDKIPERTRSRWKRNFRAARKMYGRGFVGLIPDRQDQGGPGPQLSEEVLAFLQDFINIDYANLKQKKIIAAHRVFQFRCKEKKLRPLGYKKFAKAIKAKSIYVLTRAREGKRAAYPYELSLFWYLGPDVPRHGDRVFHIAHLDHTQAPFEVIDPVTGENLGKPWLTFLIDARSRRFLAVYLSFEPPSYRSCMMALRICVLKWNRLPEILVVDNGPDFRSVYFEIFCALYGITIKTRPKAEPRFGSPIERLFRTTDEQFWYILQGNTQIMQNVRQVTQSVNPKSQAIWALDEVYIKLCKYCYELYDVIAHSTLQTSPREAFAQSIFDHGVREHCLVSYDEHFELYTFPTTNTGKALVQIGRGVKILNIYYDHPDFRDQAVERTLVDVRYDPMNRGVAYAYVKKRWVKLYSEHFHKFNNRTEREIELMSEIIRQKYKNQGKKIIITGDLLAAFMDEIDKQELMLIERRKVISNQKTLDIIYEDRPDLDFQSVEVLMMSSVRVNLVRNVNTENEYDDYGDL